VKDANLWACLAVMALNDKELSTAEVLLSSFSFMNLEPRVE
jgi:hypothetical protein